MCYKILHNHTCPNPDDFFTRFTIDLTRGNAMKLAKPRVLCDRHRNYLFQFLLLILGIICLIRLCLRHPLWDLKLTLVNYTFVIIVLVNIV